MSAEILQDPPLDALPFPKPVRLEDDNYRRFIRRQPCVVCGCAAQAHHVVPDGGGKVGSKVSDYRCIPLCLTCHNQYHRKGRLWFKNRHHLSLDLVQIQYLEMYVSGLKDGLDLGRRA